MYLLINSFLCVEKIKNKQNMWKICTCYVEGKESKGDLPVKNEVFSRNVKINEKNSAKVEIPCIKGKPRNITLLCS